MITKTSVPVAAQFSYQGEPSKLSSDEIHRLYGSYFRSQKRDENPYTGKIIVLRPDLLKA